MINITIKTTPLLIEMTKNKVRYIRQYTLKDFPYVNYKVHLTPPVKGVNIQGSGVN